MPMARLDVGDFKIVNDHLGQRGDWSLGDFSGDGVVGFADFQILELNFGQHTTAPAQAAWDKCDRSVIGPHKTRCARCSASSRLPSREWFIAPRRTRALL